MRSIRGLSRRCSIRPKGSLAEANGQLAQAKAQLTQAEAQVAVAEANQVRTQLDVDRYIPLAKQQAITQQDLDNATQNNLAAKAQVQSAKAQVETAQRSDSGRQCRGAGGHGHGGDGQAQSGLHAADFAHRWHRRAGPATGGGAGEPRRRRSDNRFHRGSDQGLFHGERAASISIFTGATRPRPALDAERKQLRLELILADGTVYSQQGNFYFADREVNQGTGAIRVAGLFANPGNLLRPGQYGRVRTSTQNQPGALLIPQRAVTELQGAYQVAVVDSENKIDVRTVKTGDRVGNLWIIDEGLKPGRARGGGGRAEGPRPA